MREQSARRAKVWLSGGLAFGLVAGMFVTGCATPSAAFLDGGSTIGSSGGSGGSTPTGNNPPVGSGGSGSGGSGSGGSGSGGSGGSGSGSGGSGGSGSGGSGGQGSGGSGSGGSGSGGSGSGGSGSGGSGSGGSGSGGSGSGGSGGSGSGGSGTGGGSTVTLPNVQAISSDSLVDSIGINTHMNYTNTVYASEWPRVLSALKALGVRHIRDGYSDWPAGDQIYTEHAQLKAAGIQCNYVVSISSTTAADIVQFGHLAMDLESLEGPNECDAENGRNCGWSAWRSNLTKFLPTIASAGKSLNIPVLGPSLTQARSYAELGNLSKNMTMNNLHIYFGGRNPENTGWGSIDTNGNSYGSFAWWLDNAEIDGPGLPSMATESGYLTNPISGPYTIPENVESLYVPRTVLMALKSGLTRTYFYELIDEVSSPGYGLMSAAIAPKPAYLALQNLIALTTDQGDVFNAGALEYKLHGVNSQLQQMLLQKRDGTFLLILWNGSSTYEESTNTQMAVEAMPLTLQLTKGEYATALYQFSNTGNVTTEVLTPSQDQALSVSSALTIVAITAQN